MSLARPAGQQICDDFGSSASKGSAWLRWILIEAAQTAKRHPDFAPAYLAMSRRRGKKIATIAVARKLLTRAFHLLAEFEADYRRRPGTPRRQAPVSSASTTSAPARSAFRTRTSTTSTTASPLPAAAAGSPRPGRSPTPGELAKMHEQATRPHSMT